MKKSSFVNTVSFNLLALFVIAFVFTSFAPAQTGNGEGFRLAPGRVELEIPPGSEKTVVLHLQYNSLQNKAEPVRLTTYLNDWNITETGEVTFHKASSTSKSASSWMIYSPSEAVVQPGVSHTIRVTISVPKDAAPGDHLAAVVIEPRANNIKTNVNGPQFRISFRMAALFYITVPGATRIGSLEGLKANVYKDAIKIIPTIKNTGNSAVRPTYSLKIVSADNETVFEKTAVESPAVLGQSIQSRPIALQTELNPGKYQVFYKVNFNDGKPSVEGITNLTVPVKPRVNIAKTDN